MDKVEEEPGTKLSFLTDKKLLPGRFLLVSNRLPYTLERLAGDEVSYVRGVGGLVTALDPVLRMTGGTWIGWSGIYDELPEQILIDDGVKRETPYHLRPVHLTPKEVEQYYLGYSNNALWPLFHYFQEYCDFNVDQWQVYQKVNRRFADAIVREYREGDLIWIQDYHLFLVPGMVRRELPDAKIGFFLHIPFPAPEIFLIDPQARALLAGLLGADLIGFHVESYARNFLDVVHTLTDLRYSRDGRSVTVDGRRVRVGSYPISIGWDEFDGMARAEDMDERVKSIRDYYRADILAVGVDRLDYTKGVAERLQTIETMLDRHPDLQGKFTFIQISAPSRTAVVAYQEMRDRIEQMVGRINGRFGGKGCIPIDYRYEGMPQQDLVALYRAADLAMVTPLRDGMNLVAKEYVASRADERGVLVLSRFAGAAVELKEAVMVNPYDPERTSDKIYQAIQMPEAEQHQRMRALRKTVQRNDIRWWLERYLRDLV